MKNRIITLTAFLFLMLQALPAGAEARSTPDLFITAEPSEKNLYVGVPFCIPVKLYIGEDDEVAGVAPLSDFDIPGFEFVNIPDGYYNDGRLMREEYKGKKYYTYTIANVCLLPRDEGSFRADIPDFQVTAVTGTHIVQDLFWGAVRQPIREKFVVNGKKLKLKVNARPQNPPKDFSGGYGSFAVNVEVRPQVSKNSPDRLYVEVRGQGDLSDASWSDLLSRMPPALGVRSVSQNCEMMVNEKGQIISCLVFECDFTPVEYGLVTIPALSFKYFDTDARKFRTVTSKPVEIEVVEDSLPSAPPTYQEI